MKINQLDSLGEGGISPEPTQIEKYCNLIIYWLLISLAFLYPLFANPVSAPSFTMPKLTLLRLITVAILAAWAVKIVESRRLELVSASLNLPLLIFILIALASAIASIHPLTALFGEYSRWEGWFTLFSYALISLAAMNSLKEKKQYTSLLLALFLAASLISILAILEYFKINIFFLIPKTYHGVRYTEGSLFEGRVFATFGNPLNLGAYLALLLPLGVTLFLRRSDSRKLNWLLPISLILMTIALLLTYGRAAWLGTLIALAFIFFFNLRPLWRKRRIWLAFLGLILFSFILFSIFGGKNSPYTLTQRALSTAQLEESAVSRLRIWRATLPMIRRRPLLGFGADTYKLAFTRYRPAKVTAFQKALVDKAHNEFLQIAATLGLFGLATFLWLLYTLFWHGGSFIRRTKDQYSQILMLGLLAGALAYLVQLQFNFSHLSVAPLFWLIMGLAFGLRGAEESLPLLSLNFERWLAGRRVKQIVLMVIALLTLFLIAGSIFPLIADIHFAKASDYQSRQLPEKALEQFEQAARLNPLEELYFTSLGEAYVSKALSTKYKDYFFLADLAFARAQRLNPWDESAYFKAGYAYFKAAQQEEDERLFERAITHYKKGLKISPTSADAWFYLAGTYAVQKKFDPAIKYLKKILSIDSSKFEAYISLAAAYANKGLEEEAIQQLKKAIAANPSHPDAYIFLGSAYQKKGLKEEAIEQFKKAVTVDSRKVKAYIFLGSAYEEKGLVEQARKAYQKALQIDPKNPDADYLRESLKRLGEKK